MAKDIKLRPSLHYDDPERLRGRPRRAPDDPLEEAERAAAARVASRQQVWREQHNRKRVPGEVTDHFIGEEIKGMALKASDVLRILKTGRVKPVV